jgi:hypothetical protein
LAATLDDIAASQKSASLLNDAVQEQILTDVQNAFRSAGQSVFNMTNNRNNSKKMIMKRAPSL